MDMSLSNPWEMVKTEKPGVLQSIGLQRVGHNWVTEQQQRTIYIEKILGLELSLQSIIING